MADPLPAHGWRCRCIVQQLSEDDFEDFGYKVSGGPLQSSPGRLWTNPRSGETRLVPPGINLGFDHNVGTADLVGEARQVLEGKLADAPGAVRRAVRQALNGYEPPEIG